MPEISIPVASGLQAHEPRRHERQRFDAGVDCLGAALAIGSHVGSLKFIPIALSVLLGFYSSVCAGEMGPDMFLKFSGTVHAKASMKVVPLWTIDETLRQTAFARLYYSCEGPRDASSPDPRGVYVGVSAGKNRQGNLVLAPSSTRMYGWNQDARTFYFNVHPYNDCLVHFRIWERDSVGPLSHRIHAEDL